jgi:hypothetical protein
MNFYSCLVIGAGNLLIKRQEFEAATDGESARPLPRRTHHAEQGGEIRSLGQDATDKRLRPLANRRATRGGRRTRTAGRDVRLIMVAGDYARRAEDPEGQCRPLPLAVADQAHRGATQISHRDAWPETTVGGRAGSETELVPARDPARL